MSSIAPGAVSWFCYLLLPVLPLCAQPAAAPQEPSPPAEAEQPAAAPAPKLERFAFGFRIRTLPWQPLSVMTDRRVMDTTFAGRTAYDLNSSTSSLSPSVGGGLAFEFRLARRVRMTAEALFHRVRYERKYDSYSGSDDPATAQDERSSLNITERTKGRLWDLPLLVHYRGLQSSGPLSHLWISGGLALRTISSIRTSSETKNPDGSGSSSFAAVQPSHRNLIGAVIGVGLRFIDEFNIKVTPEIRYTRWSTATFAAETTRSPRGQLEISIGFTR